MRNVVLLVVLGAGAIALVPQATARQQAAKRLHAARQVAPEIGSAFLHRIAAHRDETWRWQRVMLQPRTPFGATARHAPSIAYRKWVLGLWQRRATAARRQAHRPPHRAQWLCIHRHEAPWQESGAPYFGGLQMDVQFQRAYGLDLYRAKGTADHWSPLEQMWVAERAYRTRGFLPWPNTAQFCGLL